MGHMKVCGHCDQAKPLECFTKDTGKLSGYRSTCKVCTADMVKARRVGRRTPCATCGAPSQGVECRRCQTARATLAAAEVCRKPELQAVRRAKAQTRRWLRSETGRRCSVCGRRAKVKYCSYACFSTTQVPSGNRQSIKPRLRAKVIARDGYVCQICHRPTSLVHDPRDDFSPEIDHVIPVRDGGRNLLVNLRVAHRVCNRDRNLVLWST